jgi:hypothetical protein
VIRRPLFLLFSLLVCGAAVAFLAYRPGTIAGVHARELAKSVAGAAGGDHGACRERPGDTWLCTTVAAGGRGSTRRYRVTVHGHFGCWKGSAIGASGGHAISGCITIADYL